MSLEDKTCQFVREHGPDSVGRVGLEPTT